MDERLTSLENIVELSKNIAEKYLNTTYCDGSYEEDHIISDMNECLELCDKLLTYDYFSKSESYLENNNKKVLGGEVKYTNDWYRIYKKEFKVKKKDLTKMLKLIIRNIEEI